MAAGFLVVLVPPQPTSAATSAVPRPDHVVVVIEENHAGTEIVGSPDAPYITSLAAAGANFTASFGLTHPSQPNYVALFSGSTQGLTDDSCPHSYSAPSLGDQVLGAGLTFAGYSESLPSPGYTGCGSGAYARKHSPWTDFPAIPATANQPFTAFPSDYSTLPAVSFVVPNLQNDMHDGTVAQGDTWLKTNMSGYVDWAKQHNSLFVLTFDEDDNSAANRIATIFAGQQVVPGTYPETINHYNVLRTLEDAYGLPGLGTAATSTPITDVWTGNRPPTAAFTSSCPGLTCSFDGGGSADPDGTIAGYQWSFGDGSTGSGATTTHTYAAAGPYTPMLTVTDDKGATGAVTHPISVGTVAPVVQDSFNRTVTGGLGRADVGGAWSTVGTASSFSVANGSASLALTAPGKQLSGALPTVVRTDADLREQLAVSAVPVGGPVYLTVEGRLVSSGNEYSAKLLVNPDRSVTLSLIRLVGGANATLAGPLRLPGITYAPGLALNLRIQVFGTTPTHLQARAWAASGAEPASWQLTASDTTAALQQAGATGTVAYLSSSATNAPVTVALSNLVGVPVGGANAAPTAAFTSSCTQLTCAFDGAGSTDPDGTVSSWSWDFGDGASGTGGSVQHAFAVAGTYTVRLTVTDGQSATGTVTHPVSPVAAPVNRPPAAAFTVACAGLTCSVDGTGSSDDEGVVAWTWNFGDGGAGNGATTQHTYAAAGTYAIALTVADADDATGTVTHSVTVTAADPAFVRDTFNRTVSGGLGTADVGGAWTATGRTVALSVASGRASARLPQGTQAAGYLPAALRTDADVTTSTSLDAVPVGGPGYITVQGRRVGSGNEYSTKLLVNPDGSVTVRLIKVVGGTESTVGSIVRVPGVTYTAGTVLTVHLQVTGTSPTQLRARVWPAGTAEPTAWQVSATDATSTLQAPGAVGFTAYVSSALTNPPITVSFGPLTAQPTTT